MKLTLFSQVLSLVDRSSFNKQVRKYTTDKHIKGFDSWTHLVSMLFCHLGKVMSVREISQRLRSATGSLNHMGVNRAPCKSTLSYQNKHRSWELFRGVYFDLLDRLEPSLRKRRQYASKLRRKIYLMDATVVPLCLSLFDWASYRRSKGAVKLHTVLDYDTHLPVFVNMSEGRKADVKVARQVKFTKGSVVVVDRAYVDYEWLNNLDSMGCYFVTRLKSNTNYETHKQISSINPLSMHIEDTMIKLTGQSTSSKYSKPLRMVRMWDKKNNKELVFVTNQTSWTAQTISDLYKARRDIEVFFKHIKQSLRIKTFIGTSPNAVLIQVWTAMIAILLLKYLQQKAEYKWNLSNLVGFLRINLFVKIDLWKWINEPFEPLKTKPPPEQLKLF